MSNRRKRDGKRKTPRGKIDAPLAQCANLDVHEDHNWKKGGKNQRCMGVSKKKPPRTEKRCAGKSVHTPHTWDGGLHRCPGISTSGK